MHVRTKEEVLHEFRVRGISISAWARARGFSVSLVYQVIAGSKAGVRGQCHQIAVALGLKEGLIAELSDLPFDLEQQVIARSHPGAGIGDVCLRQPEVIDRIQDGERPGKSVTT